MINEKRNAVLHKKENPVSVLLLALVFPINTNFFSIRGICLDSLDTCEYLYIREKCRNFRQRIGQCHNFQNLNKSAQSRCF